MYDDDRLPLVTCPKCGTTGRFHHAEVEDNNSGCLIFLFGGLLPYLLFRGSQSNMLICERCHYIFKAPAPALNAIEYVIVAILLGSPLLVLVIYFFAFRH